MKTKMKWGASLLLTLSLLAGSGALAEPPRSEKQAPTDRYGDPLPSGAIARLGTVRFRHGSALYDLLVSPDGRTLISAGGNSIEIWDAQTGRRLQRIPFAKPYVYGIELTSDGTRLHKIKANGSRQCLTSMPSGSNILPNTRTRPQQP